MVALSEVQYQALGVLWVSRVLYDHDPSSNVSSLLYAPSFFPNVSLLIFPSLIINFSKAKLEVRWPWSSWSDEGQGPCLSSLSAPYALCLTEGAQLFIRYSAFNDCHKAMGCLPLWDSCRNCLFYHLKVLTILCAKAKQYTVRKY